MTQKIVSTLILSALLVGSVACSSKNKKEETEQLVPATSSFQEPAAPADTAAENASLGTNSSGRGH